MDKTNKWVRYNLLRIVKFKIILCLINLVHGLPLQNSDLENFIMCVDWEAEGGWNKSFCIIPLEKVESSDWKTAFHPIQGFEDYCIAAAFGNIFTDAYSVHFSPKKQNDLGMLPEKTVCRQDFELVFKSSDGSPACVKPLTAKKLIQRGWATR